MPLIQKHAHCWWSGYQTHILQVIGGSYKQTRDLYTLRGSVINISGVTGMESNYCLGCCGAKCRLRPYHVEHTASRPISQVKQRWALLVLGSETAWESGVL